MESFSFEVPFDVPTEAVFSAFWNLADWPSVARHVTGIDIHHDRDGVQVLTMQVQTGSRSDSFRSVRVRQESAIFFFQPAPPPALRRHYGWWHVAPDGNGGSVVTSEHWIDVDPEQTRRFLAQIGTAVDSDEEARKELAAVIRNNSRQTMEALRRRLENGRVGAQEATR